MFGIKKTSWLITILIVSVIYLGACSNDDDKQTKEPVDDTETEMDGEEKEDDSSSKNHDEAEEGYGDQLDLVIGDTGTFETLLGVFEVTLNGVEIMDARDKDEYDGQELRTDYLFRVNITVKNISDETYSVDDFLGTLVINDDLEGSGYQLYGKDVFDSLEDISGELKPGEEKTGELMVDVLKADEYYFMRRPGNTAAGGTNEVIFTIPVE